MGWVVMAPSRSARTRSSTWPIAGEGPIRTYDPDAMACPEPLRPDEQAAIRLVRLCLPEVEVCLHDDDSEDMMYDLELRWPDGHAEAMEVTTDTAPERRQLYDALERHGTPLDAIESQRDWFVWLETSRTDVRRVRAKIDPYLSLVEQEGLTRFSRRQQHSSHAVATVRRDLGVNLAFSREPAHQQPKIVLVGPDDGWWYKPEAVNHAVERHASANAEKLARSGHDERHLFVLIETISFEASSALVSRMPPGDPPQLPEAITTAWAAGYGVDGAPVVWRVRRTGRWEVLL